MKRWAPWTTGQPDEPTRGSKGGSTNGKNADAARVPPRRMWWTFVLILLINYLVVRSLFPDADAPVTVPYTVFKEQDAKGNVRAIYSQGVSIEGRFIETVPWPPPGHESTARA